MELLSLLDVGFSVLSPVHAVLFAFAVAFLQFPAFVVGGHGPSLEDLGVLSFVHFLAVGLDALGNLVVDLLFLFVLGVSSFVHVDEVIHLFAIVDVALSLLLTLLDEVSDLLIHLLALVISQNLLDHGIFILDHAEKSSVVTLRDGLLQHTQTRLLDRYLIQLHLLTVIDNLGSSLVLHLLSLLRNWRILVELVLNAIADVDQGRLL